MRGCSGTEHRADRRSARRAPAGVVAGAGRGNPLVDGLAGEAGVREGHGRALVAVVLLDDLVRAAALAGLRRLRRGALLTATLPRRRALLHLRHVLLPRWGDRYPPYGAQRNLLRFCFAQTTRNVGSKYLLLKYLLSTLRGNYAYQLVKKHFRSASVFASLNKRCSYCRLSLSICQVLFYFLTKLDTRLLYSVIIKTVSNYPSRL